MTLTEYLNSLASFAASFEQKRYDEYGALLETSRGLAYVRRPGRFRWSYTAPYLQSIIADGETLWIYDEDLEQVTVNPVAEAPAGSPAELLVEGADIEARYDIADGGVKDGNHWYRLSPKVEARDFREIELALAEGDISAMRLVDNLGQTTLLEFADVRRNSVLADELFKFTPPPGIDVIEGMAP